MANKSGKRATKVSAFTEREVEGYSEFVGEKPAAKKNCFDGSGNVRQQSQGGRRPSNFFRDISSSDGPKGLRSRVLAKALLTMLSYLTPNQARRNPGYLNTRSATQQFER